MGVPRPGKSIEFTPVADEDDARHPIGKLLDRTDDSLSPHMWTGTGWVTTTGTRWHRKYFLVYRADYDTPEIAGLYSSFCTEGGGGSSCQFYDGDFHYTVMVELTKAEYDEHLAFETFPVLVKLEQVNGAALLGLPE